MKYPAFMFWPERYWLDAFDLTDAEHGIYLQLLIHQWNTAKCQLPNDDEWLAKKMRRTVAEVAAEVRPVLGRFFQSTGNYLYQAKLLDEFQRLVAMVELIELADGGAGVGFVVAELLFCFPGCVGIGVAFFDEAFPLFERRIGEVVVGVESHLI